MLTVTPAEILQRVRNVESSLSSERVPLLEVSMSETQFAMVSEWMPNGTINQFAKTHRDVKWFDLVCFPFGFLAS